MKVYHAPNTRSVRILWLLEELGLPHEVERFDGLGDARLRGPDYRGVHPMGRVPALEDGAVRLFESGAIVEYILAHHGGGRLRPAVDSPDFPAYLQWLHFAEGMLMPQVNILVVETIILPEGRRSETNINRARRLLTRMLGAVEARMTGREFLAGGFSGADIMTGHACIASARLGGDIADKPAVAAYIDRLRARPALARAFAA